MRYPAAEKLEVIRLVEQSALPVRRTLDKIGIPRATFYRWYDLYRTDGPEALEDRAPKPDRVWNRIPDDIRERIVRLALDEPALSPRELAVRFTDSEGYFVSDPGVFSMPIGKLVFAQLMDFLPLHTFRRTLRCALPFELSDQNLFTSRSISEHGVCAINVSRKLARYRSLFTCA